MSRPVQSFTIQDPVTLERMSGQEIVDAIVKELKGELMQDMSKPPGTIVPMNEKELKDYQSQLQATAMIVHSKPSAEEFAKDFDTYIAIQKTIDDRMKDSVMDIQGKKFRKKAYWRAVATAFNVTVEPHMDEYFKIEDDWGYRVTYKAWTPSGRVAYGDGTVMASEKRRRDGSMVDATHHNVRGHAHTRAINRAVSNLVGFGEVSAEEMPFNATADQPQKASQAPRKAQEQPSGGYTGEWDGNLVIKSGKNKGKRWSELPSHFLEWTQGGKAEGTIVEMGAKELGRRAKVEAAGGGTVDAEEIPLPLDTPPGVEAPRFWDKDDDGYQP